MDKTLTAQDSITLAFCFTLLLWSVKLAESLTGVSLHQLGVYPQSASGLIGIITAPLIHGSWQHLISNTLPTLVLGSMLIYGYPKSRWWVLATTWTLSGLGVWLFARSSYHIGASGLGHGIFFFLFVVGILRRDSRSSALLMVAFFMYGTMLWTIFPYEPGVSFESHLFGALSGAVCAFIFRHSDPKPEKKTYTWEDETADSDWDDEDSIIGDEWKEISAPAPPDSEPFNSDPFNR